MSDLARLSTILDTHQGQEGALLPILHDVQAAFGFIHPADAENCGIVDGD